MPQDEVTVECLACSRELRFAPAQFFTRCEICEDDRPLPLRFAEQIVERPALEGAREFDALVGRSRWRCKSAGCGAMLSAPQPLRACPCCGGELFEDRNQTPVLEADGRLGFLIESEGQARGLIQTDLGRLGVTSRIERLERVYLPMCVWSGEFEGSYHGERGVERGNSHSNSHSNRRYISWSPCSGTLHRPMQNLRGSAAASPPPKQIGRLEPWDYAFCEPYDANELDAPSVHIASPLQQLIDESLPDVREELREEAKYDIGGDEQRVHTLECELLSPRFRIIMLPVWIARLTPDAITVVVNGRTGEVAVAGHASENPNEEELALKVPEPWYKSESLHIGLGVLVLVVVVASFVMDWLG